MALSPRRAVVNRTLLGAAVVAACLASLVLPATPQRQTSGDEPHYLVTALSLAHDRDLDVSNQYAAQAYRPFHAPALEPQGRALPDGRIAEPHDPLLPALLAGSTAVGGWRAAKVTIALFAGAVAAVLAAALTKRCRAPAGRSALVVVGLLGTAPFAVYGAQIYPEVPAALAVAAALAALLGPATGWHSAAVVAAVVALPWLSIKHVPVAAVLAVALLVGRWRDGQRRQAAAMAVLLVVAGAAYVLARLAWYGGVTVYAAGSFFAAHGGEVSVLGTDPNILGRSTRLLALLVDRHFGLAAWQPAWLLLAPAFAAYLRRRPPGWGVVSAVLGIGWLNATFLAATMHGFWFPGRHVIAVLPAGVLILGWWAAGSRTRTGVLAFAVAAGAVTHLALLAGAATGETTAIFFTGGPDPVRWAWMRLLPDYARGAGVDWLLHGAWVAASGVLLAFGWRTAAVPAGAAVRTRLRRDNGVRVRARAS